MYIQPQHIVGAVVWIAISSLFVAMILRMCCGIVRVQPPAFGKAWQIAVVSLAVLFGVSLLAGVIYPPDRSRYGPLITFALTVGLGAPIVAALYKQWVPLERYGRALLLFAMNLIIYLGLVAALVGIGYGYMQWID